MSRDHVDKNTLQSSQRSAKGPKVDWGRSQVHLLTHVSRVAFFSGLIFSSTSAFAQGAPDAADEMAQLPDRADDQNVIMVTAQKREQDLQRVPISIDVVGADAFEDRNLTQLSQLPALVPGFEFVVSPSNNPGLTFRGIGPQAGNVAFDSSIGMFTDGVFLGNIRLFNQTLFDVARAEFIKGSQSALLGKNATVGALSLVNATPVSGFEARVEVGAEFENGGEFANAMLNLPLSNSLTMRVAGTYTNQDGYIRNVATGLDGPVNTDWGVRGQLEFDDGNGLDVLLSYQHTSNTVIGSANQCVPPGLAIPGVVGAPFPNGSDISVVCGDGLENRIKSSFSSDARMRDGDDYSQARIDLAHLTVNYDLGDLTLTSITAGVWSDSYNVADFDFDAKDFNVWVRDEQYRQYTQEIRLASNDTTARWQYLVGAFFLDSNFSMFEDHVYLIPDFPPGDALEGELFNGSYAGLFDQADTTISAFGQLTFAPSEILTFNLGARYTYDRKEVNFGRTPDLNNLTLWNTILQAPFAYQQLDTVEDNLLSGSLSVQYEVSPDVILYGSASRSGKAGGYGEFAGIPADPALPLINGLLQGNPNRDAAVRPERANAYELGFKTQLLDRTLTINGAAFWTDVFDLQLLAFTGQFVTTNNRVRSRGGELSIDLSVTPELTFSTSGTYAHVIDLDSRLVMVNAPEFSGGARIEWQSEVASGLNLTLNSNYRYRTAKFNQLGEQQRDGAFGTLALGARLESDGGWWLNLNAENVLNARGANFGFPGPDPFIVAFKTLEPTRHVNVSMGISF